MTNNKTRPQISTDIAIEGQQARIAAIWAEFRREFGPLDGEHEPLTEFAANVRDLVHAIQGEMVNLKELIAEEREVR